ncbi:MULTISPECIES: hypothetical protein [unclassified Bradyrhizobium]|uniref:hypothetical protein n=1 Tax=unclassified Bradyrhizobium TaxID=2631580 RepID=UPI0028EA60DF|nr:MULTISPECIES: hypothetical protein [unclassified Bradyrhizobium]
MLDEWIGRRLRAVVWTQWKRGPNRFDELRRRGVDRETALKAAGNPRGPWRLANSAALARALPKSFFASRGLPYLEVRRVVWNGRITNSVSSRPRAGTHNHRRMCEASRWLGVCPTRLLWLGPGSRPERQRRG